MIVAFVDLKDLYAKFIQAINEVQIKKDINPDREVGFLLTAILPWLEKVI